MAIEKRYNVIVAFVVKW